LKFISNFFFLCIFTFSAFNCALSYNQDLIRASARGDVSRVKHLIDLGADVNAIDSLGYTAFMAASVNGQLEVMELLKKSGARALIHENEIPVRAGANHF